MVTFTMNGKEITAKEGTSLLEAARDNGVKIPTLCYDKSLSIYGGCRMCIVEIEGSNKLVASCTDKVCEGMVVFTESDRVIKTRQDILGLILSNHPKDCLTCEKGGSCELQDYAYQYGVRGPSFIGEQTNYEVESSSNPAIERDLSKCILCGKCVRVCSEVQASDVINFAGRGFETKIATGFDLPLSTDNCRLCGQCVSVCPTGALTNKDFKGVRPWESGKVRTTCPFCGTGCNFDLNVKDGKVVGVTPNPDSPVNGTELCVKGRFHTDLISSPNRLTKPLIKVDGKFEETSWEIALDTVAKNLMNIKETYGPDSISGLSSARCTNEENYLFQKMMRAVIGTHSVDHCART
jgi:formate dehydrogenase alpha subunit